MIASHSDDPFDELVLRIRRGDADHVQHPVERLDEGRLRRRLHLSVEPSARILEDDDVPALKHRRPSAATAVVEENPHPPLAPAPRESRLLLLSISTFAVDSDTIPRILPLCLAALVAGDHPGFDAVEIIDCRFDYEFRGGHIAGAVNVLTNTPPRTQQRSPGPMQANGIIGPGRCRPTASSSR